jgi:phenol 2-monooxygenase
MPVFTENSGRDRDARILPSRELPLPRISQRPTVNAQEREVVVIGVRSIHQTLNDEVLTSKPQAGPSGLFLTLLLARHGLDSASLLCLDSKPGTLKAGQADGLQPRTLEVFKSLGIASEILDQGCHMEEVAFWNPVAQSADVPNGTTPKTGIERTAFAPDVNVPARFQHEVTIHQGRIERILQENLALYAPEGTIRRSHRFTGYEVDTDNHSEFPILVKYDYDLEDGTVAQGSLRTKYLVGADGAHSKVRGCMDLELKGETSDHIWGVCDFVADTDFPDIRNRCAVHSSAGSVMVIPRERIATGEYLTRIYVQTSEDGDPDVNREGSDVRDANRKRREAVTLDYIFKQASAVFAPYKIAIKNDTTPDWWAAYQIGQRMSDKFSSRTPDGVDRVFIVGDGKLDTYLTFISPSEANTVQHATRTARKQAKA